MKTRSLQSLFLLFTLALVSIVNAQIPANYYVDAHGKEKAELKTALHQIIRDPCDVLPYGWGDGCLGQQFVNTDNRGDGRVWDMYSDKNRYFPTYGVNIEHSLPKSWWGVSDETADNWIGNVKAYRDLHHLVPSDTAANTAKSNYAYGEVEGDIPFSDRGWIIPFNNNVSKVGTVKSSIGYSEMFVFEPADQYKGDFARMVMYVVTCYEDLSDRWRSLGIRSMLEKNTYPVLSTAAQRLLLKWHRMDPVDQKEIDRNNAVYAIQHNRNPFIDFKNLPEYIWGDSVQYAFSLKTTLKSSEFDGALPDLPDVTDPSESGTMLSNSFMDGLAPFLPISVLGPQVWISDATFGAKISGFSSGSSVANEDWLVSPVLDFSKVQSAVLKFTHVCNKGSVSNVKTNHTLWYSTTYSGSGEIVSGEWTQLPIPSYSSGTSWNDWVTPQIILPSELNGQKKVSLAFKYLSSNSESATWQVKDLSLEVTRSSGVVNESIDAPVNIWVDNNGVLHVRSISKIGLVRVWDMSSRNIYEQNESSSDVEISLPEKGVYLVQVVSPEGKLALQKVIR